MIRDLEQGRSRSPRRRSLRALIDVLALSPDEAAGLARCSQPVAPVIELRPAGSGRISFEVLGPFAVRYGPTAMPIGNGRHRVVLARLALTANTTVSRDELVDVLWADRPPVSAVNLIHSYVSRLRRTLEPDRPPRARDGMLALTPYGYRLNVDHDQIDLLVYRDLVRRTDVGPEGTLARLDRALALWRDRPLADVAELRDSPLVEALTEDRIDTTIKHAQLAEALSRHALSLGRLRLLAREHPLHETLQARLMHALAATGERAAALDVYRRVRHRLVDELGIDPGPQLVDAQRVVLRQQR